MISRGLFACVVALMVFPPASASALTLFGTAEDIHPIQDVDLAGPDGQTLFLGYKTSTTYFIGGVSVRDDGYVLGLRSDHSRFLDMPPTEAVTGFQTQGLLPSPLPSYSLGLLDYLRGYSLWIVVALAIALYLAIFFSRRPERRHE
jgi:hypothetical protein